MDATAKFISIPELLATSDPSQAGILRVIGRVERYDLKHSLVTLQDHTTKSLQIAIDTTNIEPFSPKVGLLYQFIGEAGYRKVPINEGEEVKVVVKTLVHRCLDGLNMEVYLRSHEARMKNLSVEEQF